MSSKSVWCFEVDTESAVKGVQPVGEIRLCSRVDRGGARVWGVTHRGAQQTWTRRAQLGPVSQGATGRAPAFSSLSSSPRGRPAASQWTAAGDGFRALEKIRFLLAEIKDHSKRSLVAGLRWIEKGNLFS